MTLQTACRRYRKNTFRYKIYACGTGSVANGRKLSQAALLQLQLYGNQPLESNQFYLFSCTYVYCLAIRKLIVMDLHKCRHVSSRIEHGGQSSREIAELIFGDDLIVVELRYFYIIT